MRTCGQGERVTSYLGLYVHSPLPDIKDRKHSAAERYVPPSVTEMMILGGA